MMFGALLGFGCKGYGSACFACPFTDVLRYGTRFAPAISLVFQPKIGKDKIS